MENFLTCIDAVLPPFIIMAVGYFCKRIGLLSGDDVPLLNRVAFRVFMPCMLFCDIYASDLNSALRPGMLAFSVITVFAVYGLAFLIGSLTAKRRDRRGVMIQGIFRSNFLVVGIPIAEALGGAEAAGVAAIVIAFVVPVYNVLAVVTLSVYAGEKLSVRAVLKSIATNPLIIASLLGVLFLALGWRIPGTLERTVSQIGDAGSPLLLFILGAFFKFGGLGKYKRELTVAVLGRLVLVPGVVFAAALAMGFRGAEFAVLLGCFSAPNAVASFTMAEQMGGDAELAGDIVVMTNAVCAVTIFLWSFLFKSLAII